MASLFSKLFKSDSEPKEEKLLPWINLVSISQLETIKETSKSKTQIIFKHSTRCGISKMVINQFVDQFDLDLNVDLYYLDLLSHRDISNQIAIDFQVIHQSPQLLIVKNGVTVAHSSHGAINDIAIETFA